MDPRVDPIVSETEFCGSTSVYEVPADLGVHLLALMNYERCR